MNISTLTKEKYANTKRWNEFYHENNKSLRDVPYDLSWHVMFAKLMSEKKYERLDKVLKEQATDKHRKMYPLPEYIYAAFLITPADSVKVVIIGQDPYFNCESLNGKYVPQAMGLSFSVPHGVKIPSSLDNIYANMINHGHLKKAPETGNLSYWASQGCLMLNTALTVEDGQKESHMKIWEWFTDYVISYISEYMENIVFVLWGAHAYSKMNLIDQDKHHTIVSSHPSGLSANKPFKNYPAFMHYDHFGEINKYLEKNGKSKILWD